MSSADIHLVEVTIPWTDAVRLAVMTDARTANDATYVVKSVLADAWGHGTVRPWRILDRELKLPDIHEQTSFVRVLGVVDNPRKIAPNAASRKLGITAFPTTFTLRQGDILTLDIECIASKSQRAQFQNEAGEAVTNRIYLDYAASLVMVGGKPYRSQPSSDVRRDIYRTFIEDIFVSPSTGCTSLRDVEILSCPEITRMRKTHGMPRNIKARRVHGRLEVEVSDPVALATLIRLGHSKFKDLGSGSIFPAAALDEVEVAA